MTGSEAYVEQSPAAQPTPGEAFYASLLDGDDRAVYDRAPGDADLTGDIRLLRALIGRLCEDGGMMKKEAAIRQAIGILYRLIQVQTRTAAGDGDLEGEIRGIAASFLSSAGDEPDEDAE